MAPDGSGTFFNRVKESEADEVSSAHADTAPKDGRDEATDGHPAVLKFTPVDKAGQEAVSTGKAVDTKTVFAVSVLSISRYDNPRHEPENLYAEGYTLIGDPSVTQWTEGEGGPRISLIHMATSDNLDEVAQFVKLIEKHENRVENGSQSIVELAEDIETYGQLYPVLLRRAGDGLVMIDGGRRLTAVLYNLAKNRLEKTPGKPKLPAAIQATDIDCSPEEVRVLSIRANLGRKDFSVLAQGKLYADLLNEINPKTGRKFSLTEASAITGVKPSTVRNRANLWKPRDEEKKVGLTDRDRQKLAGGEMILTEAIRKANGEKPYESRRRTGNAPRAKNQPKMLTLREVQQRFDATDEKHKERRQAFAEVMGITLAQATKESKKRIAAEELAEANRRKTKKPRRKAA